MSELRNLTVNPKPFNLNSWQKFGACEITVTDQIMRVVNTSGGGGMGASYPITALPAGEYVYRFDAVELTGYQNNEQFALLKVGSAYQSVLRYAAGMDSLCTDEFTLDTAANIELLIVPPGTAGGVIRARRFMISSKNDYAAMLKGGVTWFDGDGAVKN